MPGDGESSSGQSGAVSQPLAPQSAMLHQISPPQYLDLKHGGEVAENWKLWKEIQQLFRYFKVGSSNRGISVSDVQTYDRR